MKTGPSNDDVHFLPTSYLSLYADDASTPSSFLLFIPEKTPTAKSSLLRNSIKEKEEKLSFPFKFDRCSHPPGLRFITSLTPCERMTRGMPGYTHGLCYMLLTIFMQLAGLSKKYSMTHLGRRTVMPMDADVLGIYCTSHLNYVTVSTS
jgi:hypothetical protein